MSLTPLLRADVTVVSLLCLRGILYTYTMCLSRSPGLAPGDVLSRNIIIMRLVSTTRAPCSTEITKNISYKETSGLWFSETLRQHKMTLRAVP